MSQRMERKKQQKRSAIIDAAEKLMAKKGYWDMTMDEVAVEADVAKGTIYLYFNSKEALYAAVVSRIIQDMNVRTKQRMDAVDGGYPRIKALIATVIEWNADHQDRSRVLNNAMSLRFKDTSDPNVREFVGHMNAQHQMACDAYLQAIKDGDIRADLDPLTSAIFMRMALWVAINPFPSHELVMEVNGIDRARFLNNALDLMSYSVMAEGKTLASIVKPKSGKALN